MQREETGIEQKLKMMNVSLFFAGINDKKSTCGRTQNKPTNGPSRGA